MKPCTHKPRRPGITRPEPFHPQQLTGYLSGAVGMTALLGARQLEAAVVYWNPPDRTAAPAEEGFRFDMVSGAVTTAAHEEDYTAFSFVTWNYGSGDDVQFYGTHPGVSDAGGRLAKLALGAIIGAAGPFNGSNEMYFDAHNLAGYPWNTNLDGTAGFVGLQFAISGSKH